MVGRSHDHTMNISIKAIASGISQVNKELTQIASAVKGADGKNVSIKVSLSGDAEKQIQSLITSVGNIEKAMNSINTRGITSLADAGSTASKSMTDLQSQIGAVNKSLDSINSRNLTSISEEAGNVSKSFMDATSSAGAFSSALDGLSAGNLADIASEVGNVADEFERATSNASAFADVSSSAKFNGGSSGSYGYRGMPNWSNSYGSRYGGMRYTGQEIGLSDIVGSLSGGKSPYELTVENAFTKERNKAIMTSWRSDTGNKAKAGMEAYNAFDQATNNSLISLNALGAGANAFRATANASSEQMAKLAPQLANFGGYVEALGYSEDVAQTAVMKLARGLGGAFTALDQYGITKQSLLNQRDENGNQYWNGDENDLEGYMNAVDAIAGEAMKKMKGTATYTSKMMSKQVSLGGYALGEIEGGLLAPLMGSYAGLDSWLLNKTKDMGLGAKILDAEGNETYRTTKDGREIVSTTGFNASSILVLASQIIQGYRTAKDTILAFVAEYKDLKRLKKYGLKGIFSDYRYDMYGNGSWIPTQHELIKEMEKNQPKQIKAPCPDMSDCPGMNGNGGTKNNKKKKSSNNNKSGSKKKDFSKINKTMNGFAPEIGAGLGLIDATDSKARSKIPKSNREEKIHKTKGINLPSEHVPSLSAKDFRNTGKTRNRHKYNGAKSVVDPKTGKNTTYMPVGERHRVNYGNPSKANTGYVDPKTGKINKKKGSNRQGLRYKRYAFENSISPSAQRYLDHQQEKIKPKSVGDRVKSKSRKGLLKHSDNRGKRHTIQGGGNSILENQRKRIEKITARQNRQKIGAKNAQKSIPSFFQQQDKIMSDYKNDKKTQKGRYINKYGGYQKRTLGAIYDVKDLKKRAKKYIKTKKDFLSQEYSNGKRGLKEGKKRGYARGRQLPYEGWSKTKSGISRGASYINNRLNDSFLGTQYGALKRQGATVNNTIKGSGAYKRLSGIGTNIKGNASALGNMTGFTPWFNNTSVGKKVNTARQKGIKSTAGTKLRGLGGGMKSAGGAVLGGVSKGMGAIGKGIGGITGAISGMGIGFMSILGPIGAVIGGIMLLTSLLDMLGIDWLSPLQTAFGGLWDSLQPVIGGFNEWLQGVAEQIGPFITQLGSVLGPILQTLGSFLAGGLGALAQAIAPILSAISSLFSGGDGGSALGENLSNFAGMISGLGPIVEQLWAVIGKGAEGMGNAIASFITSVANGIASAVTTIGTAVTNNITMLSTSITTSIISISTAITNSFMNFAIIVASATATAFLKLMEFQVKAVSLMGSIATDMVNAFKNNFTGIDAKVDAEMRGAYNTLSAWGDRLVAKCEEIGDRMQNSLIHLGIGAGSPGKIWTGVDDEFRGTHGAMMSRGASLVRGALNIGKGVANSFMKSYNSDNIGYVPDAYNVAPVSPDVGLPKVTEPKLFKQLRDNKQEEKLPPVINFYHTGYLGDEEMAKSAMKYFVDKMDFENKRANRTV